MKRIIFLFISLLFLNFIKAQDNDPAKLHETGLNFMKSGDNTNAILVFKKALQIDPNNLEIAQDLALTYYLQREFEKGLETIKPLMDRDDVQVQTFQIAGNLYKSLEELKECEKMYKKALKKFQNSGALYNEYGELLWARQDFSAINQWEKGIETDPNYPGNYYNAARYYYFTTDKVWSIIYGEIYVNLDSYSSKTAEIKSLLLESYKKFYIDTKESADNKKKKSAFSEAFNEVMEKNSSIASKGITPDILVMLRTRFVLDWFNNKAPQMPFRLFDYQKQLLQAGLFEAYNQWIFGAAGNLSQFEAWTKTNSDQYNEFSRFQRGRVFKLQPGQYYQSN